MNNVYKLVAAEKKGFPILETIAHTSKFNNRKQIKLMSSNAKILRRINSDSLLLSELSLINGIILSHFEWETVYYFRLQIVAKIH